VVGVCSCHSPVYSAEVKNERSCVPPIFLGSFTLPPSFFGSLKLLNLSDPESILCRCQELTDSGSPANVDVVCGEASREGGAADAA
jgi:hypothetical protein